MKLREVNKMTKKDKKQLKKFAKRLQELINENNETAVDVAKLVDMNKSTIYRYLNAEAVPKRPTIEMIAEHFGVNPAWLSGIETKKYLENKKSRLETIAAHADGDLTEEEMEEVEEYIEYLLSKRNK
jgi:transcriptional regulator with XRE-family HTH domain